MSRLFIHAGTLIALLSVPAPALHAAQEPADGPSVTPPAGESQQPAAAIPRPDPDRRLDPLQPDFNLAALPTTLRVPGRAWAFRVTHRFTRPLGEGDIGNLVENLFGLDSGSVIGLEFRYGVLPGTQVGIHRTSGRTIQLFAQHNVLQERDGHPLGLDGVATLEGENNLRQSRQGGFGVVLSRTYREHAAFYATPMLLVNANPTDAGSSHTALLGLGTRLRVLPTVYVVAEASPRLAGYRPGDAQISLAIEKRAGGHLFQLNFSNGFGTTYGQLARGGVSYDDWYIGFNISRKFFR